MVLWSLEMGVGRADLLSTPEATQSSAVSSWGMGQFEFKARGQFKLRTRRWSVGMEGDELVNQDMS